MNYYSNEELKKLGFRTLGENVKLSKNATVYNTSNITLGNHVRIDDFCVLSGKIEIKDYVHIAPFCGLFAGEEGIVMETFSGLSSRCSIYAVSDDYSGEFMTNPTVKDAYRNVMGGKVVIGEHVIVGTGSCIMPNVVIGEGSAIGSMSLVNKNLDSWGIYAGIPVVRIKERKRGLLKYAEEIRSK